MASALTETVPLPHSTNPSKQLPLFGLGTWLSKPHEVEDAVYEALSAGYILIDAAAIYKNEAEVGRGIKRWGGDREKIWVTSKLWNNSHQPAEVEKALDKTLKDLQLDYLDLYLIHWPCAFLPGGDMIPKNEHGLALRDTETTIDQTWAAMEKLLETGKVKNIGISNFTRSETESLLKNCKVKPANIQLELHPYLAQPDYTQWLHDQGLTITAYSPFGNLNPAYESKGDTRIVDTDAVKEIASRTGKNENQVVLSWGIAKGFSVVPKSVNADRIKDNAGVFVMDAEDVKKIDALNHNKRYNDASTSFGYVFFADEKPVGTTAAHAFTNAAAKLTSQAKTALGVSGETK